MYIAYYPFIIKLQYFTRINKCIFQSFYSIKMFKLAEYNFVNVRLIEKGTAQHYQIQIVRPL